MAELALSPGKSNGRQQNRLPVRVDLAFLLITFFMLTTTLMKPKAMPLVMPVKDGGMPVGASSTMTICLGKNNQALWYMGMVEKPLTAPKVIAYGNAMEQTLLKTAKQVFASTGKNMLVIIKPSQHSVYKNLVSTLDELNITQTSSYAIADITPKDIELLKQKNIE